MLLRRIKLRSQSLDEFLVLVQSASMGGTVSRLCKGCSLSRFNLWQLLRNKVKGLLCCHFSSVVEGPVHKGQVS